MFWLGLALVESQQRVRLTIARSISRSGVGHVVAKPPASVAMPVRLFVECRNVLTIRTKPSMMSFGKRGAMSNPPISPALTEEEWKLEIEEIRRVGLAEVIESYALRPASCAALCLYGQEYGFSYRDLHDLEICLLDREPILGTHLARLKDLRNRIAALLPPPPEPL